ncbi:hypothetical protein [Streptomyces sp. NBC_01565]|uniref:hypothetical protein n=1 Tax=Streptomyces sp. NBC_01565 TaxID=2975881 RepID=UPI0022508924|nr:hypothetical protein [Streptomyces sp. NBC_01565]MCX4546459.1 hypothetical protein [Streptomyces sp. NBC_01565]
MEDDLRGGIVRPQPAGGEFGVQRVVERCARRGVPPAGMVIRTRQVPVTEVAEQGLRPQSRLMAGVVHVAVQPGRQAHQLPGIQVLRGGIELRHLRPRQEGRAATRHPALKGHSLMPVLHGSPVRQGILNAVESITTLDASFWFEFADPEAPERVESGDLRPDWNKRGFLRAYSDERYTFGRYFSPLNPNRPTDIDMLLADNDVVLYDREQDPAELRNLATDPAHHDLVERYRVLLEDLIDAEIGPDTHAWVTERPLLLGWPTWHGDDHRPGTLTAQGR